MTYITGKHESSLVCFIIRTGDRMAYVASQSPGTCVTTPGIMLLLTAFWRHAGIWSQPSRTLQTTANSLSHAAAVQEHGLPYMQNVPGFMDSHRAYPATTLMAR